MWSGQRGHAAAKAGRPAPRAPHQNDLRPIHLGGQPGGQGAVKPVVKARSQWGSGLVKAVNPLSQPLRTRERRGRECGTALTTVTTVTGGDHDREAPRPGVPSERAHRPATGAPSVEAWRRRAVLALPTHPAAWLAVRRGAHPAEPRSRAVEPRTRAQVQGHRVSGQPCARWSLCSSSSVGEGCRSSAVAGFASVVTEPSFFGGSVVPPPSALQATLPLNSTLNWRKNAIIVR